MSIFLAREVNRLSPRLVTLRRAGVEANLADLDGSIFGAGRSMDAAMRGADAGDEFAGAERLGDVVVGAQFERFDFLFFSCRGR